MTAPVPLIVNIFPGGFNWPIFAAIETGAFEHEGIRVELRSTTGSVAQMTALHAGECDIVMTAFDNIVAYVEGEGEAPIGAQPDFFAFLGSDNSFLSLVAQADISSLADLKGRRLSVDASSTGYAFALFDMLEAAGLRQGDYAIVKIGGMAQRFADLQKGGCDATLLSAPYDLLAQRSALHVLQRLEGPYQGNVGAARRSWARAHADALAGYIRAYLAAVGWLYEPANQAEACAILARHVAAMTPDLAAASYDAMLDRKHGFFRAGCLDAAGVQRVLRLRSRYAAPGRRLGDPARYIDLDYWRRARASA